MTDYAKPTTPAAALRDCADAIDYRIKSHRQKITEIQAVIEALSDERDQLTDAADRYDKYQPKPVPASGGNDSPAERND